MALVRRGRVAAFSSRHARAARRGAGSPGAAARRRQRPHRHAAERAGLLHPPQPAARRPRPAAAGGAGRSVDEADDQRGLAHVLEHMAFNGTSRFKPGELVSYLESIGARFGPHVNAYTSYDETVYMLDVPTDRPKRLAARLRRAQRFRRRSDAGPRRSGQGTGRRHRGVARPSRRRHAHAAAADRGDLRPHVAVLASGCRSARPSRSSTFSVKRLRDFYSTNYRANRMAVIAVGDLDPDEIERLVRQRFGPMPAARGDGARRSRFRRIARPASSRSRTARRRARR